jgi:hypothetical protein
MANGTLAASQIEMLSQSGTGITTITPPATNTNRAIAFPDASGTVATLGTTLTAATAVTASGTSVDFTGIPSWVKRITVMFSGVSTSGTSFYLLQLGDSGGIENTGYVSQANTFNSSPGSTASTAGFLLLNVVVAAGSYNGVVPLCKIDGNSWTTSGVLAATATAQGVSVFGGVKTLSDTLDRVRITTVNGTDTFDAGSINILYEG